MKKGIEILIMISGAALMMIVVAGNHLSGGSGSAEVSAHESRVRSITTVVKRGVKTVDWSPANNKIAFGRWGSDGYVDVCVMNPDGSDRRSLTDGAPGCPQKHNGNPAWHPSGEYIVFTAEKEANPDRFSRKALPGSGINCDLWVVTADGKEFHRLTDYPIVPPFKGVIHPHFSHDGEKLLWAERVGRNRDFAWGAWAIKIADFVVDVDGLRLENVRTYQPGRQARFYEAHAFSPDDRKILFSGNPDGQSEAGFDIYEFNPETLERTNLTGTPADWDEHAQYSPDGTKIAWISSVGLDVEIESIENRAWWKDLKSELWIMDADGSNKERLTHFNQPGYPEYLDGRRVIVSDISFSPDGRRIIALVACESDGPRILNTRLVVIEL